MSRLLPLLAITILALGGVASAEPLHTRQVMRQPVAIERVGDELLVLNGRAGTLSVVDLATRAVTAEVAVAKQPSAMTWDAKRRTLLVCDEGRHELVSVVRGEDGWAVRSRVGVARYPVGVAVTGERAVVTSLWSRRLSFVDLDANVMTVTKTVDLVFAPRHAVALTDDRTVVVADAFGGRVAVVDAVAGSVTRAFGIEGHNVGGLAFDPATEQLFVTHQTLQADTGTEYEAVFWGTVLKNVLRTIPLAELRGETERLKGTVEFLGFPSDAAGDPAGVAVTPTGATAVAIAGVDGVVLRRKPTEPFGAFPTERGPVAVAFDAAGAFAFVANGFGQSLTIVDVKRAESAGTISLGPSPEPSLAEHGERLFHDARLSLDGWYSCHSCHTGGHANGRLTDNISDGGFGNPKRVPSLLGTRGTAPYAWNGSSETLTQQTKKSIRHTMQGEVVDDDAVAAIVAYLGTLEPPPGLDRARGTIDERAVARGARVFADRGCADCHEGPRRTSDQTFDVGLKDETGLNRFNPPSLLGVSQRDSFLHDGRAKSLRAVFETVKHPNESDWSQRELNALLAYLRSL